MLKRIVLFILAALLVWLAWEWITFPDVAKLATEAPKTTAFIEQRKRELRKAGKNDEIEWKWVSYSRISPYLRRAVLVAEDNEFYEHQGVDTKAMREAFERNWKRGKITHGGSTITQQLAKNLYLSPSRNPLRKVREYFIARALEKRLTKKRILEIYLNVVEMGERTYGAEAGARHHFGKSASALSASQAALLAGCLPNPRIMNPSQPNKRLRARQRMILSRMKRWGYLFEREVLTEKKPAAEAPKTDTTETTATADPSETTDTSGTTETTESTEATETAATTETVTETGTETTTETTSGTTSDTTDPRPPV
ncbi:MAG TPA: monofunctional biosynthetic peptidoglycan transglycosylase [Thermoanaerobaculia bacterium]